MGIARWRRILRNAAHRNSTAAPNGTSARPCEFRPLFMGSYVTYLQYFLKRSLTRPQCNPAMKLSMYLPRPGPSLW